MGLADSGIGELEIKKDGRPPEYCTMGVMESWSNRLLNDGPKPMDDSLNSIQTIANSEMFLEISTELLSKGYIVQFTAPGKSMQPSIFEGEIITVQPVSPSDVRLYDILLYRNGKGLLAHRVVRIEKGPEDGRGAFILRGDSSIICDEPVQPDQIMGRVVEVEREGRRIALATRWAKTVHIGSGWAYHLRKWIFRSIASRAILL
jgi:hypothetical protein